MLPSTKSMLIISKPVPIYYNVVFNKSKSQIIKRQLSWELIIPVFAAVMSQFKNKCTWVIAGLFIKRVPSRKQFHFLFSGLSVLPSMLTPLNPQVLQCLYVFLCFICFSRQPSVTIKEKSFKATRKLTLTELRAFFLFLVLESRMVESDGHTDLNYGSAPHDLCSWTSYWTSLSCGFLFHKMNKLYFLYKAVILG